MPMAAVSLRAGAYRSGNESSIVAVSSVPVSSIEDPDRILVGDG